MMTSHSIFAALACPPARGLRLAVVLTALILLSGCGDDASPLVMDSGPDAATQVGFGPTATPTPGGAPPSDAGTPLAPDVTIPPTPDAGEANTGPEPTPGPDDPPQDPEPSPPGGPDPVASTDYRYIRVITEESPSWVSWFEIEVIGTWTGMGGQAFNLAPGKTADASSATADGPAALAIDGDLSTSWNAGDFPSAELAIDLNQGAELEEIRLRVAQMPSGHTRHVLQAAGEDEKYETLYVFDGHTEAQDWLVWPVGEPAPPGDVTPGPPSDPSPPDTSGLSRGLAWVKSNPMFISGLSVSTGAPTAAQVNEYFDGFHGTAAHLWNDGLPGPMEGWQSAGHPDLRWVSWVQDNGTSPSNGQVIGGVAGASPGRIGYQIGDEPGLNGNGMEELMGIDVGVNAVRAADPDALIIVNFSFWAEDIDEMLDYYGEAMDADVYSYDRYGLDYKEHETLSLIRESALKWNRPYWRYLRSFHYVGEGPGPHHPSDLLWSACVGLLYGYTGHTWFLYQSNAPHDVVSDLYQGQGTFNVAKTDAWSQVAQVNIYLANLGRAITQLTSTDVRYRAGQGLYTPDGLVNWAPGAGGDPYITQLEAMNSSIFEVKDLAVGYFIDDADNGYVMIQNQNHDGAGWPIDNTDSVQVRVDFDFSGAPPDLDPDRLRALSKETGMVADAPLTSLGGAKRRLEVTLPAGDILFFKYATAAPFALGP